MSSIVRQKDGHEIISESPGGEFVEMIEMLEKEGKMSSK